MKLFPILCAALLLGSLPAAAQKELPKNKKPKQSKTDADVWSVTVNTTLPLEYKQAKELLASVEEEAKLKMWSPQQLQERKALVPAGGYLSVEYARPTLTLANPSNLLFIVQAPDGQEILRRQLNDRSPNYSATRNVYWSISLVPLSAPLPTGSKVFVVEDAAQVRYEFEIRPL